MSGNNKLIMTNHMIILHGIIIETKLSINNLGIN